MSDSIHMELPIAFLEKNSAAVYFSKESAQAGTFPSNRGTAAPVRKVQNILEVALWGEDNRFPQNIEQQMAYCGVGKAALDWKARVLYGGGIIPGRIKDYEDEGKKEVFEPLKRSEAKEIYTFLENRAMFRFFMEYLQDWTWFSNCFPEAILNNSGDKITGFVHQESCDCRFKQMNDKGVIDTVYLSKMWGTSSSQYGKFDPEKKILGITENPNLLISEDNKYLKALYCVDMYDPLNSMTDIATQLKEKKGLKSAIFPVNYPSPNKTYYQVPSWDGARLGGWVEIACKIPQIIKLFLRRGQKIQYHIEVPDTYFAKRYGAKEWAGFSPKEQNQKRKKLLEELDEFLTSDKSKFSSMVTFFDVDRHNKDEVGRIKITTIENKSAIDKELLSSSAADLQILAAMGVHPTLFGAGTVGTGSQRTGGSDQREAYLIYTSLLALERNVALEPLYFARDFNKWDSDIVFRIRDTQLTTLDQNKGTQKVVS